MMALDVFSQASKMDQSTVIYNNFDLIKSPVSQFAKRIDYESTYYPRISRFIPKKIFQISNLHPDI